MTANQRLMLAVALSVVFFVAYTAIFPPVPKEDVATKPTTKVEVSQSQEAKTASVPKVEEVVGHPISEVEKTSSSVTNTIVTITNKDFTLKIDTLGRISSKVLTQEKFRDENNQHAELIPALKAKPLFVRFTDEALNVEATKVPYTTNVSQIALGSEPAKVVLTQKLPDLTVTKELTFYADGHYDATISLSKDKRYFVYLGQRPENSKKLMAVVGAMVYTNDDIATIVADGDAEGRKTFTGVELISAFDQYTATIMYGFSKDTSIILERDVDSNPIVYFDAQQTMKFNGYVGPKDYKTLKTINPKLTNAIEYGWFTFAAKPLFTLLSWLHGIFGNWGWSIIALTLIVRVVLYPLTYKGMVSMQKMKAISPKIKEIQAKYKGDAQRTNAAVMEMYKKHGANPLGGCLPMLLQIPVFFAIYRVLLNAVELQGAPWILWVHDLSRMDNSIMIPFIHLPLPILPILMGASMYYQQKLTPNNFTDPMQEKVFKFLPIIFTFFFITFPSGLVLYWFVNNLFSIAQQFIVNQQFKNAEDARHALHLAEKHHKDVGEPK